jgi:hypothetical protein
VIRPADGDLEIEVIRGRRDDGSSRRKGVKTGSIRFWQRQSASSCGRTATSDVIDASVVLTGRRERAIVVTSDVVDLRRLDPQLAVERI